MKELIESCIDTQVYLNDLINKDWVRANYNWQLAAKVELAELIDHLNFQWWKTKEPDFQQAFIELIDILHFVISDYLVKNCSTDIELGKSKVINLLCNLSKDEGISAIDPEVLFMEPKSEITILDCFRMLKFFHKTPLDMFKMYLSKDILNVFRNKNGYTTGTYSKIWGGVEDNVRLDKLVSVFDFTLPKVKERLYNDLKDCYMLHTSDIVEG